jgi:hypothetical protein
MNTNKEFYLISRLPEDILRRIYDDHFHPRHRFDKIIKAMKNDSCTGEYELLSGHLEEMFETQDVDLLLYLLKHGKKYYFDIVYKETIIKQKRFFANFHNKYEDWAMCWIFRFCH